jgi:hypothetical protein
MPFFKKPCISFPFIPGGKREKKLKRIFMFSKALGYGPGSGPR